MSFVGRTCPECDKGKIVEKSLPYKIDHHYNHLSIPLVKTLICEECEETLFDSEGCDAIDEGQRVAFHILRNEEFKNIRESFGASYKDMSLALMIDTRHFKHFEIGRMIPSPQICQLMRTFKEFPQTFEVLKEKGLQFKVEWLQYQIDVSVKHALKYAGDIRMDVFIRFQLKYFKPDAYEQMMTAIDKWCDWAVLPKEKRLQESGAIANLTFAGNMMQEIASAEFLMLHDELDKVENCLKWFGYANEAFEDDWKVWEEKFLQNPLS